MMKIAILVSALSILAACTHFRGPGDFKTNGDYATPSASKESAPVSSSAPADPNFNLEWPVNFVRVTQSFEPEKNPRHKGLDLGGQRGTPILAAHEGKVIYKGRAYKGYGNMVLVENGQWATLYAHMQKIKVKMGDYLHAGNTIGTMGRTGHATGVHLHFELMHNKEPVDPLPYLSHSTHFVSKK